MVGTLPEELPGQLALSPMDVEPASENVRTSDAPVSSRLRSARCGSIASAGTNPLDHMFAQAADGGTCQSTSFSLASSGQAPFGPRMLYRQNNRQTLTDNQEPTVRTTPEDETEVLTYIYLGPNLLLNKLNC